MAKETFSFEDFMLEVPEDIYGFIVSMHKNLSDRGCGIKIESAKSGYVVSYNFNKKVLMNYVFRKSGLVVRIYGTFSHTYEDFLSKLPDVMLKAIDKAPVCKRLIDPSTCNQRCKMGYDFSVNDTHYQKCQFSAFMFTINADTLDFIREFAEHEILARQEFLLK